MLLTGGVLLIFTFWLPHLKLRLSRPEAPIREATKLVVRRRDYRTTVTGCLSQEAGTMNTDIFVVPVREIRMSSDQTSQLGCVDDFLRRGVIRLCDVGFQLHAYSHSQHRFIPLTTLESLQFRSIHDRQPSPLNESQTASLANIFGNNEIEIPMPTIPSLLLREILHPFYIFQIFSIILWLLEDYWGYSIVIFVAALLSTSSTVYSIRKNAQRLRKMAAFDVPIKTLKLNARGQPVHEDVSSRQLVPGDVVLLEDGMVLPCDLQVLGSEANVLVNEALLTGESIPVAKMSYTKCITDITESLLFGGTTVIQSRPRGSVRARVLSTGFQTAKGVLMRSILVGSTSANVSEFTSQGFVVVGVLFIIALAGVLVNSFMIPHIDSLASPFHQSLDILDVVTIAVPPALPVALSVGISFAMSRLRKSKIFCISPPTINLAGQIEHVCFDKTGTLTIDELELNSLLDQQGQAIPSEEIQQQVTSTTPLFLILAACHALMKLEDTDEVVGDPLELKMFQSLGDSIVLDISSPIPKIVGTTADGQPVSIEVIHRFPFASRLQRMSCFIRVNNTHHFVVMKGSPEMVVGSFCRPTGIGSPWERYTLSGFRVLAAAVRFVPDPEDILQGLSLQDKNIRDTVEVAGSFDFAGCLIFENPLKESSGPTIHELYRIGIRSVMITGDHPLTALHVAKECGIVVPRGDPQRQRSFMCNPEDLSWNEVFATKGAPIRMSWDEMMSELLVDDSLVLVVNGTAYAKLVEPGTAIGNADFTTLLRYCNVWARMKPDQKASLVGYFQEFLGLRAGMVGDGSNDCSALKKADVGLSLSSEAEATMAAPFTSSSPAPSSLLTLLREGRCALVTSLSAFKYIVFYSMIQFTGIELLYSNGATFGNWHFLFQDLFAVLPLALVMSNTHAHPQLSVARPPSKILSLYPLLSMVSQVLLQACFQVMILIYLKSCSFYQPVIEDHNRLDPYSFETTAVFHLSMYLLVFSCLALCIGRPFRKEFWTNRWLVGFVLLILGWELFALFAEPTSMDEYLQLKQLPRFFQFAILGLGIVYGILSTIIEFFLGRGTYPPAAH